MKEIRKFDIDNLNQEESRSVSAGIMEKLKALVKAGNASHIRVRKDDILLINLPVTAGIVIASAAAAAVSWALIAAAAAAAGLRCTVEVEKTDGSRTVIFGKEEK